MTEGFEALEDNISETIQEFDFSSVQIIPVSATVGDNLNSNSDNMPWYTGKSLLDYLETIKVDENQENIDFVLPVQRVCRPSSTFRGFQGQISSGQISVGDEVVTLPSGEKAKVKYSYYR